MVNNVEDILQERLFKGRRNDYDNIYDEDQRVAAAGYITANSTLAGVYDFW